MKNFLILLISIAALSSCIEQSEVQPEQPLTFIDYLKSEGIEPIRSNTDEVVFKMNKLECQNLLKSYQNEYDIKVAVASESQASSRTTGWECETVVTETSCCTFTDYICYNDDTGETAFSPNSYSRCDWACLEDPGN